MYLLSILNPQIHKIRIHSTYTRRDTPAKKCCSVQSASKPINKSDPINLYQDPRQHTEKTVYSQTNMFKRFCMSMNQNNGNQ